MVGAMSGRALAALALMPSSSFDRVVEVADAVIVDSFFFCVCACSDGWVRRGLRIWLVEVRENESAGKKNGAKERMRDGM